jgi:pyruvate/2-oxoglutarate/acetoin dehydrogenase E1 component
VKKTGRAIVSHEAPLTGGFGAEISASIQVINNLFVHNMIFKQLFYF